MITFCLLNGFIKRNNKLSCIFTAGGNFTTWRMTPLKVRLFPYRERKELFSSILFKEMAPRSLNTFLFCKIGKSLFKRFTSPRGRERIYRDEFPRANVLRKAPSGPRI